MDNYIQNTTDIPYSLRKARYGVSFFKVRFWFIFCHCHCEVFTICNIRLSLITLSGEPTVPCPNVTVKTCAHCCFSWVKLHHSAIHFPSVPWEFSLPPFGTFPDPSLVPSSPPFLVPARCNHTCSGLGTLQQKTTFEPQINGWAQDCCNSSALVMKLLQSCAKRLK